MKQYIKKFLPFSFVIAVILVIMQNTEQFKPVMYFAWICYTLFFILSLVTYYFSAKTMKSRFANFMNVFFSGIILKLIITGIVVLIYKSTNPDTESITFIIPFTLIYFSFLVFETLELVKLSGKTK